jgi:hypothetical protein
MLGKLINKDVSGVLIAFGKNKRHQKREVDATV